MLVEPAILAYKPSEYVAGGRYFQSIEISEGAKLTNVVIVCFQHRTGTPP
jgi:hypothetical protein